MPKAKSSANFNLSLVAATALIVGAGTFLYFYQLKPPAATSKPSNSIQILPLNQLPSGLPTDIVLAGDAKVISSYTGVTTGGEQQSTLIYTTSETPSTLINDYINYLGKNGWVLELSSSGQSLRFNQAGKEMSVSTSQNGTSTVVSINLTVQNAT